MPGIKGSRKQLNKNKTSAAAGMIAGLQRRNAAGEKKMRRAVELRGERRRRGKIVARLDSSTGVGTSYYRARFIRIPSRLSDVLYAFIREAQSGPRKPASVNKAPADQKLAGNWWVGAGLETSLKTELYNTILVGVIHDSMYILLKRTPVERLWRVDDVYFNP